MAFIALNSLACVKARCLIAHKHGRSPSTQISIAKPLFLTFRWPRRALLCRLARHDVLDGSRPLNYGFALSAVAISLEGVTARRFCRQDRAALLGVFGARGASDFTFLRGSVGALPGPTSAPAAAIYLPLCCCFEARSAAWDAMLSLQMRRRKKLRACLLAGDGPAEVSRARLCLERLCSCRGPGLLPATAIIYNVSHRSAFAKS